MTGASRRRGAALAVALAIHALAADSGSAQDAGAGSLTIQGTVCPIDYAGNRFAEDCSGVPAAGATYQVRNTETGASRPAGGGFVAADDTGTVVFDDLGGLAPGSIQILAEAPQAVAVPGGYTVPAVTCVANGDRTVNAALLETAYPGKIVELEARAADDLRCDIYFVPFSLPESAESAAADETASSGATAPVVPSLPAAVYAGDCPESDDEPGALVSMLTELAVPAGQSVGQAAAVVAATSYSSVPLSLKQLLSDPLVIGVRPPATGVPGLVACGEIGGVINEAGDLVIGLRQVGGSGRTGIAFLSPSAAAPERTDVSVFLVMGLTADEGAGESTPVAFSRGNGRPGSGNLL